MKRQYFQHFKLGNWDKISYILIFPIIGHLLVKKIQKNSEAKYHCINKEFLQDIFSCFSEMSGKVLFWVVKENKKYLRGKLDMLDFSNNSTFNLNKLGSRT